MNIKRVIPIPNTPNFNTALTQNEEYKEITFYTLKDAEKYVKQFKKKYGYEPEIHRVRPYGSAEWEFNYVIIKPKGLKRID